MAKDSKRSKKSVASTKSAAKPPTGAAKSGAVKSAAKSAPKSAPTKAATKTSTKRVTSPAVAPMKVSRSTASKAAALSPDQRMAMIAEAAYYMAERRQFAPGNELEDWLAAERSIDAAAPRA